MRMVAPRIEVFPEKKLVGKHLRMSLSNNKTFELWQGFMSKRKEIRNNLTSDLFSMQVFDDSLDFEDFNQDTEFDKWAVVEVADFTEVPDGMSAYLLKGGLYAVFLHIGPASAFRQTFQFIFNTWLPGSGYEVDQREHFEILGSNYKNNDPNSEEEVWIPIKERK